MATTLLFPRQHIQDHNEANTYQEPHWGYASRVLPCSNDAGTCAYLDGVYWMHDMSIVYSFIMWGVLLGIAVVWVALRGWRMGGPAQRVGGIIDGICNKTNRISRRWLLADTPLRSIFGRVTILQVVILAIILGYLLIFSLVGIVYKTWVTPIKGTEYHNTRSGLGGFSDRVGVLAYALTPFTVLLGTRESILTMLTGIPYQHFNFLHRWTGRVIFVQSVIHTIGWTIIEGRLYEPQPKVYAHWLNQLYAIFGCVALLFICFLTAFSTKRAIRWTGYEFFKITHSLVAILYIGACWGHWDRLWVWMVPSLILIVLDQFMRMIRTFYTHSSSSKGVGLGFRRASADVQVLGEGEDLCIRVTFGFEHSAWKPGQHFFLCFPSLSIWQSHPFTVASSPDPSSKTQRHVYLLRARKGQTAQLAGLAGQTDLPVVITGPYGPDLPGDLTENVLAVSGGTGVTFTLPIAISALQQSLQPQAVVDFVWVIRYAQDLLWLKEEFDALKGSLKSNPGLRISIMVTREFNAHLSGRDEPVQTHIVANDPEKNGVHSSTPSSMLSDPKALEELMSITSDRFSIQFMGSQHPSMQEVLSSFLERAGKRGGYVQVLGSGPEPMGSDLRKAVAGVDTSEDLRFYWDSRE